MKRRWSGVLILLVLTFLFAGSAYAATNSYKDSEYGFSFSYPESWKLDENAMPPLEVSVSAGSADDTLAAFGVMAMPRMDMVSMIAGSEAQFKETLTAQFNALFTDFKLLAFQKGTLQGEPCYFIEFAGTQGPVSIYQRQCMVDHGDYGYTLTWSASQSSYDSYKAAFKDIQDSFKF